MFGYVIEFVEPISKNKQFYDKNNVLQVWYNEDAANFYATNIISGVWTVKRVQIKLT